MGDKWMKEAGVDNDLGSLGQRTFARSLPEM